MNFETHELQVAQQLAERDSLGLFEVLLKLKGLVLQQQYTVRWLYAVGGQSVLYLVERTDGHMAIAKLALHQYHRAAYISIKSIQRSRERLKREAEFLQHFHSSVLPEFVELVYDKNPLYPRVLGQQIIEAEPYLIMELIQGFTLLDVAQLIHSSGKPDYEALEHIAWHSILTATDFSLTIQEHGYLYADFSPRNFMLTNETESARPVRVLDAGSLLPLQPDTTLSPPLTPVYVPPAYYEAYKKGILLWPTTSSVMYTLGKALWEPLTNLQPYPSEDPDLAEPHLKHYSDSLQELLAALIQGRYADFEQLKLAIKPIVQSFQQPLGEQVAALLRAATKVSLAPTVLVSQPDVTDAHRTKIVVGIQSSQTSRIQVLRCSPDGQYFAVARGKSVELWDIQTLQCVRSFQSPHTTPVVSIDFDGSGQYLASGSFEGIICCWHTETDKPIWHTKVQGFNGQVALSAQGDLLAVATEWSAITFYPQRTLARDRSFESVVDQGTSVAIGKHQSLLAVGGLWGMRLWNLHTGQETEGNSFKVKRDFVDRVAFGNNDQMIVALCINVTSPSSSSIMIWNTLTHKLLWHLPLSNITIRDFRLSPQGQLLLASTTNGELLLWDAEQQKELAHLTPEYGPITTLDFTPEPYTCLIATRSGEIYSYHLEKHRSTSSDL